MSLRVACHPSRCFARPKLSVVGSAAVSPAEAAPRSSSPVPWPETDSPGSARPDPAISPLSADASSCGRACARSAAAPATIAADALVPLMLE
jgi:hypothetical protein